MAITPEQRAEINRANAQKSTGPRTPEGKARSRMNARRHGLTGQLMVFEEGERQEYNRFAAQTRQNWQPSGPLEDDLIQHLIDTSWLLRRNDALELNLASIETARVADSGLEGELAGALATHHFLFDTPDGMKRFEAMGRHRARIEKSLSRYRVDLIKAQAERRKNEAKTLEVEGEPIVENEANPPSAADRYYRQELRPKTSEPEQGGKDPEEIKANLDAVHIAHRMDPDTPKNFLLRSFYDELWMAKLTQEEKDAYFREMDRRARIKLGEDPATILPSGWIPPGLTKMGTPRRLNR